MSAIKEFSFGGRPVVHRGRSEPRAPGVRWEEPGHEYICVYGVDYGRPLKILATFGKVYVLECKGHTTWLHVGASHRAKTTLFLVEDDGSPKWILHEEVEPGHRLKAETARLIEKAKMVALRF